MLTTVAIPMYDVFITGNVYDHGVNNAEGGLRWPSEVYRLNHSLADGVAAMKLLTDKLDEYQNQVQGTFCADEVFCGRDPERGTETCTVVETMASYEHSFATLGTLELMDRIERTDTDGCQANCILFRKPRARALMWCAPPLTSLR